MQTMKMALMVGDTVPDAELRSLGFEAVQMFFGWDKNSVDGDPTTEAIDTKLKAGNVALAAMTLHIDLVGPKGCIPAEVERAIHRVEKTAALKGRFGANEKPLMIWHPSGYPQESVMKDRDVFNGLCEALGAICKTAEAKGVNLAVEMTRAGSVDSAEAFMRIKDKVGSPALRVCMDAANIVPDRTPLERAIRMLGHDIVMAHGKDSRFSENGECCHYGATGTGKLDYPSYIRYLKEYSKAAYFVLEYYQSREELLSARDIVSKLL